MSQALHRILIVDDEPDVLEVLAGHFAQGGRYEVMTAQQAADAVMIASFHRPDTVLLDISMPGVDGLNVLRAIRAVDLSIPVVMLTGDGEEKVARDTFAMGAFDYVARPFNFPVLDRIVVAAVAAGASRAWSPFGAKAGAPPRAFTPQQVAALARSGSPESADRFVIAPFAISGGGLEARPMSRVQHIVSGSRQ